MRADPLRIGVLTTDTAHHRYFLRRLAREMPVAGALVLVLFEDRPYPWAARARRHARQHWTDPWRALALNPYVQPKHFARAVDAFEAPRFFPDGDEGLALDCPVERVRSVNDEAAGAHLAGAAPDLLLVYGTGLIEPRVYERASLGAINAHGGKVPEYRGLDTNLWAAFEGKPEDMYVTWHRVDAEIDTGPVYMSAPLEPTPELGLYSLRYFTTLRCTEMCLRLVSDIIANRDTARPQDGSRSRYYEPMPWRLKLRTDAILRAYGTRAGR